MSILFKVNFITYFLSKIALLIRDLKQGITMNSKVLTLKMNASCCHCLAENC